MYWVLQFVDYFHPSQVSRQKLKKSFLTNNLTIPSFQLLLFGDISYQVQTIHGALYGEALLARLSAAAVAGGLAPGLKGGC